jgi:hypothetical protein
MPESVEARRELYHALLEDAPYSDGELFGYHSRGAVWMCDTRTKHRFGFEAEKEDEDGQHIARLYQGDHEDNLPFEYRAERDGSLDHDGFELVSPIYNLEDNLFVDHLSNPILSYLIHSDTSHACGGHITYSGCNVDTDGYRLIEDATIALLYALFPYRAKRRGYARYYNKSEQRESDRYKAINIKRNAIEFRIFSAIKSLQQLTWRVELLRIILVRDSIPTRQQLEKELVDITSPLHRHLYKIYGKRTGEKVLLALAYGKMYEQDALDWQTYSRVRTNIPTDVRREIKVKPEPRLNPSVQQTQLFDVCDHSEEA